MKGLKKWHLKNCNYLLKEYGITKVYRREILQEIRSIERTAPYPEIVNRIGTVHNLVQAVKEFKYSAQNKEKFKKYFLPQIQKMFEAPTNKGGFEIGIAQPPTAFNGEYYEMLGDPRTGDGCNWDIF